MEKKQFQTESKRVLDLMINSIYTNREIFLRELISNASDATDKRYYNALSAGQSGVDREALAIEIKIDRENRILTISDSGCGMTEEELTENLGVIAKSGSLQYKTEHADEDMSIIGQFGVGFYAAFMVSSTVRVITRSMTSDTAFCWESSGADGYTVTPCEKTEVGTDVVLVLKEDTEEENYSEFLDSYRISGLVKKYSDYIRYPIRMDLEKRRKKEDSDEYETYYETETLNSMVPIWKRAKGEADDAAFHAYYQERFMDYTPPKRIIRTDAEGMVSYSALMFLPSAAPMNYYTKDFEKGLALYTNGVLIMEKCQELLPDYFSFVRGIVDSQDLSLNISRETLQQDRRLKMIASGIEKKIRTDLEDFLKNDRAGYEEFFAQFGLQLKYGIYMEFGANKDKLKDLILFRSSSGDGYTTLSEYVARMRESQKYIYFASGQSAEKLARLPQAERVLDAGMEVLYCTEDIDEFALKVLMSYDNHEFRSVSEEDLELPDEKKGDTEEATREHQELLDAMKEVLGDRVARVGISARLKSHPVCLSTQGGISLEMERVLSAMPGGEGVHAERVLELNPSHPVFAKLVHLHAAGDEKLKSVTALLHAQALMMEGLLPDNMTEFSDALQDLLTE
ncbi:MAG: molecular chaperone HtpG [Oscillospiraceae bacterium]|nr:molecular chaperone HtpG [Oscillospiraceae bacterium]